MAFVNPPAFFAMLYRNLFSTLAVPSHSYASQTIIITGSNTGLGLEAARHIVRLDAEKVILAVRNREAGEAARKDIEKTTGRKGAVEVWWLDMASFESVGQFSERVRGLRRVDGVLLNAGVLKTKWEVVDGWESTLAINVISTLLLTLLLLPTLRTSAATHNITPRISIVSSFMHHFTTLPAKFHPKILAAMNTEATADLSSHYIDSKLLQILYLQRLSSALSTGGNTKSPVTLTSLDPGFCVSSILRNEGVIPRLSMKMVGRTTEAGSRTLVSAMNGGEENEGWGGEYLVDGRPGSVSRFVQSELGQKTAERVWEELNEVLEGIVPGVLKNI